MFELKLVEIDGVKIEVRDYGTEQLCRQAVVGNQYRSWVATDKDRTYDQVLAWIVRSVNNPSTKLSSGRVRL